MSETSAAICRSTIVFAVVVERMAQRLVRAADGLPSDLSLIQAKNSGAFPRAGRIGDADYTLHGFGCRFDLESGEIVDFDLDRADLQPSSTTTTARQTQPHRV